MEHDKQSLPALVRGKLGYTKYRMAKLLNRTPCGYATMETTSRKYTLRDLCAMKSAIGASWDEFGNIIEQLAK